MTKECGSCANWFKFKNPKMNGRGLCEFLDASGKAQHGKGCPHWVGKKYDRVKEKQINFKRPKGKQMKTKFKIGDAVYQAYTRKDNKQHDCPDCLGSRKWEATSPAGENYEIDCPRCSVSYHSNSDMNLNYSWYIPDSRPLTIGSVRTDSHADKPISYMCVETGVGSGSIYYEECLFTNKVDALKYAEEMSEEANEQDTYVIKQYNEKLKLSDYEFSKIQELEK